MIRLSATGCTALGDSIVSRDNPAVGSQNVSILQNGVTEGSETRVDRWESSTGCLGITASEADKDNTAAWRGDGSAGG